VLLQESGKIDGDIKANILSLDLYVKIEGRRPVSDNNLL